MSRLARNVPGYSAYGSLEPGTIASDIVLNWNQIPANGIRGEHISPGSITTERIQVGTVTGILLADGTITAPKIQVGAITGDRVAFNTLTGDNIAANTIEAEKMDVDELSAISADMGEITAGNLNVVGEGVIISSDAEGGEPYTGLIMADSEFRLRYEGYDTVTMDGETGEMTAYKFTLLTAASGARLEIGSLGSIPGLRVYDSSDVVRTKVTEEGYTVITGDPATATREQKATFLADGSTSEGSIFLMRDDYTLTRV